VWDYKIIYTKKSYNIYVSSRQIISKNKLVISVCIVCALLIGVLVFVHFRFPKRYCDIITMASETHNIEPSLIYAVILSESGFDRYAVSSAGAMGLMQIMPSTAEYIARERGIEFSEEMLFDPAINIDFGTYYLARMFRRFGNQKEALAAYNAGEGNVSAWRASDLDRIPFRETRDYVRRVTFARRIYRFLGV